MIRQFRSTVAIAAVTFALTSAVVPTTSFATGTGEAPAVPTLVFYEIPGCSICKRINGWLDTLKQDHPNKAQFMRKPSTDPANYSEMAARGVEHHGVAILSPEGQAVWSMNAHTPITKGIIEQAFDQFVLGSSAETPPQSAPGAKPAVKPAAEPKDKILAVDIAGMDCGGCAEKITGALTKLNGVARCEISFEEMGGRVHYDPAELTEQAILESIINTGYKPAVKTTGPKLPSDE